MSLYLSPSIVHNAVFDPEQLIVLKMRFDIIIIIFTGDN